MYLTLDGLLHCRLRYISTIRTHLQTYPCTNNINYLWNMGFLLFLVIAFQLVSGMLLTLYYTSDINHSYYSVMHIIQEVYYGWCLRYMHSSGASFVFNIMYFHIGRGLYVSSYVYNTNLWLSGIVLFIFLMVLAFLGYVLTWG
jgi:quinol-cytochrome oxidoreductase complex cytochrome b subunit